MKQELKFNGYTAQPSDYECQDGDLAAVLDLMPEKGALHPVTQPLELFTDSARVMMFVHETNKFKHYIALRQGERTQTLQWRDGDGSTWTTFLTSSEEDTLDIRQINAIGNTLLLHFDNGLMYFLWKDDEETYRSLGDGLPEVSISFGLQGEVVLEWKEFAASAISSADMQNSRTARVDLSDDNQEKFTSSVLAAANKFIADYATGAGKFMMPFFVRYALRLFDGTIVHHSAPVLMPCASDVTPVALLAMDGTTANVCMVGVAHSLDYRVSSNSAMWQKLQDWKDIVVSVDIFISAPLYKYDQSGRIEQIGPVPSGMWSLCKQTDQAGDSALRYQVNSLGRMIYMKSGTGIDDLSQTAVVLPAISDEAYANKIRSCSSFYLLKSIPVDDLSQDSRTLIEVPTDYLQSLVNREVMTDDYDSHDRLIADLSFVYNQRINLAGLSKDLFCGFDAFSALPYSDGFINQYGGDTDDTTEAVTFYVFLKKDGKTFVLEDSLATEGAIAFGVQFLYFYYPSTAAYKVVVKKGSYGWEFPLTPHDFLNGSVYVGPYRWTQSDIIGTLPSPSYDTTLEIPNKIYTSEIGNPFFFPLLNISTVGTGRIFGLSTAAKALSEGQFGQFPLYAFSEEGVWALEVSLQTGAFSARQPITRDVCINPASITQIDSAVLFATDRGIMLLSGSQTVCITETVDNDQEPFVFASLPLASNIKSLLGVTPGENDCLTERPFKTFLSGCEMLYAYNRQAIIVFNPSYTYAYVYSLESKAWGVIKSSINGKVPSYPEAYASLNGGRFVDYSQEGEVTAHQFLLTRPIKLDPSLKDVHKTIDTIIARGHFVREHVMVVLYGSRNLQEWFPVASSVDHYLRGFSGTPYKYYRIALLCTLGHDESVWGCTVKYTPRLLNQPR